MIDPASRARDLIWGFKHSTDVVTLLELMRAAELDVVPLTPRVPLPTPQQHSHIELALASNPARLVVRQWAATSVVSQVIEGRASLDAFLSERLAIELAYQLETTVMWRTVRQHFEQQPVKEPSSG